MSAAQKKLTVFEVACVVAGLGFGGGIMAIPYLASLNGIVSFVVIIIIAFLISVLLHLMVVEVVLMGDSSQQLVEIFGKYLFFKGGLGSVLTWTTFALIVVTFYALLAGYIVGCGELLRNFTALPLTAGMFISYVVAAGVVFFGLKAIGLSEKYAIIAIGLVLLVLSLWSFGRPFNHVPLFAGTSKTMLALYGMLMFCFTGIFSVPQAAEGLSWDRKKVAGAVVMGIGINFVFVLVITCMVLLVSRSVTEVAIIGWCSAIGSWALAFGSTFALLALLTSYWSVSYALAIVMVERLKWGYRKAWLIATFPTFLMAIGTSAGFLDYMRYAGGAMAVLLAILIPPALGVSRKRAEGVKPEFSLGFLGGPLFRYFIIAAYLLMAVGSALPLK
jgi:amino acid permease